MARKLRMGMVGGGQGAFIGAVHRIAAQMDGQIELVCGAFSRDPANSRATGAALYLPAERAYPSYGAMLREEAALPADRRMDFVCIVTPNHMHYPVASAAIKHGFHVVCDKPMTASLAEARKLADEVRRARKLFCLTHNYPGAPMVKEARELVRNGTLGTLRRIVVEYPQGWLAGRLESSGQKQAAWRTDPKQAGASCCMGDIGTHCLNLAEYIAGDEVESLCADLSTFVKGRKLDDDGSVLLRFRGGAKGLLWASQIAVGEENGLNIRVYGEKGGIYWRQDEPNSLTVRYTDRPFEVRRTGTGFVGKAAAANTRIPAGHPEGYLEAFANVYRHFASALQAVVAGRKVNPADCDFPGIREGLRGMAFVETVVASSRAGAKWMKLKV